MKNLFRWIGVLVVPPFAFLLVWQVVGGICNLIAFTMGCGQFLQSILAVASCAFAMAMLVLISERIAPRGKTLVAFIWGSIIMLPTLLGLFGLLCSDASCDGPRLDGTSTIMVPGVLLGGTVGLIIAWRKRSKRKNDHQ